VKGPLQPFTVSGAHKYTSAGTYQITVTIRDTGGALRVVIDEAKVK
jgi:PKD repeat protein